MSGGFDKFKQARVHVNGPRICILLVSCLHHLWTDSSILLSSAFWNGLTKKSDGAAEA